MSRPRSFFYITGADFIVRSAYQMGKTPLLPIFAVTLGASDAFLGIIVSVSTMTGLVLKPFVGILSDRWGRRGLLLFGTAFFAGMPFVYRFVDTPEQLLAVRVVHGLATAVYGPVTLAYVAELSKERIAERLGWFSLARNAGYVVGPLVAGWMLLTMSPVTVFTVIGLLSTAAFLPVLLLPETRQTTAQTRPPLMVQAMAALKSGARTPAVWLSGGLDASMYVALYAVKAFLPLYTLASGGSVVIAGAFFAVQEAVHMALNPVGGRIGDAFGYRTTVSFGMVTLAGALSLLSVTSGDLALLAPAALMGVAQALAFPSTVALVSTRIPEGNLGAGMGLLGTLRNAGKVTGPVLGGVLIGWLDFTGTLQLMAVALLIAAVAWLRIRQPQRVTREKTAAAA